MLGRKQCVARSINRGTRCLRKAVYRVDGWFVCGQHSKHGFVSCFDDGIGDAMRERMARVVEDCREG